MNTEFDSIEVDDTECINYILSHLSKEYKNHISENDIQYVLDLIFEYYNEHDLIDEDSNEETAIDENKMFDYIWEIIKKEKIITINEDDLDKILDGEYGYGIKMGIYTEK